MAGHSQFKNIMHRKGAQDAKRAKVFTKLIREISVAAKLGGIEPETNARLRAAISTARAYNVPKDRVETALQKAADPNKGENYEEIRYEGYGPGAIAIIVEALTDNRNRTAAEVRAAFAKHGGNLGETGSVSYMFDHLGYIIYPKELISSDQILEAALEVGADNYTTEENCHIIECQKEVFSEVRKNLTPLLGEPEEARLIWKAQSYITLPEPEKHAKLEKLLEVLENNDDVQYVFSNLAEL